MSKGDTILMKGIDISKYQPTVDFAKVKAAGYDFVIIRAGLGKGTVDSYFEKHYNAAKQAGLYVGAYWYSYATTISDAKQEAEAFIKVLKGKQFEMPVYYDLEERKTFNTGKANVSNIITIFCTALEDAGYYCGIYGGQELAQNYMTAAQTTRYAFWLAQYLKNPRYNGQYGIWQFSVAGATAKNNPAGVKAVPGVSGQCDLDYCYVDYPVIIKQRGRNGFTKPEPVPVEPDEQVTPTPVEPDEPDIPDTPAEPEPPKSYPVPERVLREGDSGEDVKWLQDKLTKVGYYAYDIDGKFGRLTYGALAGYQLKNKLEVDAICGPKTRESLKKV